jgi:hypothetical protein
MAPAMPPIIEIKMVFRPNPTVKLKTKSVVKAPHAAIAIEPSRVLLFVIILFPYVNPTMAPIGSPMASIKRADKATGLGKIIITIRQDII